MKQIRHGVFETNSSSTHSITMYLQRKNHRLPEWRAFCEWVLTLPMFKELCLQ